MTVVALLIPAGAPPALAADPGYPWASATCQHTGSTTGFCKNYDWGYRQTNGSWDLYDPEGWAHRNCTSYVTWRVQTRNGYDMPQFEGHANYWDDYFSNRGVVVNSTPAVGAIAQTDRGTFGHVAYVEQVGTGQVLISQYNKAEKGEYSEEWVPTSSYRYIHVKDIAETPGASPQPGDTTATSEHYRPFACDINGDGLAEIGLRDPANGILYWRYGPSYGSQGAYGWAAGHHYQVFCSDFNGDRLGDIGLRDPNNGIFYIRFGPSFGSQTAYGWAAGSHYQAFAGDFNGDNLADIGVRDPSNGIMYMRYGPSFGSQGAYGWAAGSHYRPFAADVNGDNLDEIGLRDPNNGIFYWRYGPSYGSQGAYGWAAGSHYQPFAGDFNGDSLGDIGVRDPSNGIMYMRYGPSFGSQGAYGWAAG